MATYISLVQFTEKGIQAAKDTTQRVTDWAAKAQSKGVSIKHMYWTLGQYDQVCVFDAPDDEKEMVGQASLEHDRFVAPEEAAMTVRDTAPGAVDHPDDHDVEPHDESSDGGLSE